MIVFCPYNKPWGDAERASMLEMVANGESYKAIGDALGRSRKAIELQISRIKRQVEKPPKVAAPTHTISKAELPEWYAKGWRIAWFEGDQVGLEWPHEKSPTEAVTVENRPLIYRRNGEPALNGAA